MTVHTPDEAENVAAGLARAAGRHFGRAVTIEKLKRESGGASRQTWSFDAAVVGGTSYALILRRDPPTLGAPRSKAEVDRSVSIDRATEFRVLHAAFRAGVRAPEVLFELTPEDGLGEAFVMRRIGGIAIARKLLRDAPYDGARKKIAGQLGEILARLHAVPLDGLPPLVRREAADHIVSQRRALDLLDRPQPVFELALGWLCVKSWRFGAVDRPAGGFGSREELWAAYTRAGGIEVDPARAHWWEVFGTVRWGIICHNQAWRHLSGAIKSMELASIGRRAVETEVDLLQLLKA